MSDDANRRWRVGDLASAAGLTVRALHHFDEIGLLVPAGRTAAGHRLYTEQDVSRLYRILALRSLGMPLAEIAVCLDGDSGDLATAVRGQLAHVGQQIDQLQQFRRRLLVLRDVIQETGEPAVDQLLDALEAMMHAKHFTADQLTQLKERHRDGALDRWRREWTAIAADAQAHLDAGADPAEPAVQQSARRWLELMDDMTGGDRAILSAMYAKMDAKGAAEATKGVVSSDVWTYMKRAFAVGFGTLH